MRMLPVAVRRVLVNAAPYGIHEVALRAESLPRHAFETSSFPSRGVDGHAIFDDIPVQKFVDGSPSEILRIVGVEKTRSKCLRRSRRVRKHCWQERSALREEPTAPAWDRR